MATILFAAVHVLQEKTSTLIQECESGQVGGMLPRRFEDQPRLFTESATPEQEDHYQGVGEADFGAVDGAIADGF